MCEARQYSDQMMCCQCGLAWDVNDPDPPDCKTPEQIYGDQAIQRIRAILNQPLRGTDHD